MKGDVSQRDEAGALTEEQPRTFRAGALASGAVAVWAGGVWAASASNLSEKTHRWQKALALMANWLGNATAVT